MSTVTQWRSASVQAVREAPVTTVYFGLLFGTAAARRIWPEKLDAVVDHVSTNLENLRSHPVMALVGSAFFIDGSVPLHIPFGIVPLGISERRLGSKRTIAIFALGHVGATLITAATIRKGIDAGYYPTETATGTDIGMSYGGLAVRFAAVGTLESPSALRIDIARAGALLGITQPWKLPRDYTATGHTVAAALGAICGAAIYFRRRR